MARNRAKALLAEVDLVCHRPSRMPLATAGEFAQRSDETGEEGELTASQHPTPQRPPLHDLAQQLLDETSVAQIFEE